MLFYVLSESCLRNSALPDCDLEHSRLSLCLASINSANRQSSASVDQSLLNLYELLFSEPLDQ